MRKLLLPLSAVVLVMGARDLHAQTRSISGRVVGSDGAGLPGVTVLVKGTSLGTATDVDGRYTLPVPASANTLVFSFVGYDTREAKIGDGPTNITLTSNPTSLDEAVVVGYGTQSRRDLTGNVATIAGKEIASLPVQSFDQALQGRAPGVNITTPNGVLNNPPIIRVRGVNSISLSSQPLIVIDGIPTYTGNQSAVGSVANNPLANLNPDDIESMDVLKDASATAIYGSRAAAGVILVTTKRGKKGQGHLSYNAWVGMTKPVRLFDILGAQDYVAIKNEAVRNLNTNQGRVVNGVFVPGTNNEGFKLATDANGNTVDTKWYDYIYRTGVSTNHSLNFSGGTDKTTYYTSVDYSNQKGMLKNNEFRRYAARLNVDHTLFNKVTVGLRFDYSNTRNLSPNSGSTGDGAFGTAGLGRLPLVLPPNISPYLPDGSYNAGVAVGTAGIGPGPNINPTSPTLGPLLPGYYNPVVELDNNYFSSEAGQIQGSAYLSWEIIKGLRARTQFGLDNISYEDKAFQTPIAGDSYQVGSASNYYRTNKRWDWQNTLQYDRTFGTDHNFSLLVGNEQQKTDVLRWGATRTQVADPFFTTFEGNYTNIAASGNFQGSNYLVSFFGRLNYNYARKYLFSFTARRDGYSALAKKYGNFYGGSLGYAISEEDFWKNSKLGEVFSFLKVTGSYGKVGNINGLGDFASLNTYSSGLYAANATLYYSNAGNPALQWETSKKTDIGLAFGFLQDRLTGEVAYYRNLADGLILDVPQAPSRGIPNTTTPNTISANIGSMVNSGVEFSFRFNAIQKKAFNWTVSGNVTTLKNRVLSLATEGQRTGTATSGLETVNFLEAGHSIGEILAVQSLGVNPANGRRLIQKANGVVAQYDHQGTGWTDAATGLTTTAPTQSTDGVYYGPVLPTWYGGFDNTFTYKGFDLGVFIQFSGGNYIYNGTNAGLHDQRFWNNKTDILDRWTADNPNAKYPRVVYGDNVSNGSALIMSANVEKGDFARLRNVQLGYSLSQSLLSTLKIASLRVYVQVQNAALVTKYSGIDPEVSANNTANASINSAAGVDRNSVGQARTYTAGLNIGF
jgi:TonB-linked SusC/RagA family outer membrane protein